MTNGPDKHTKTDSGMSQNTGTPERSTPGKFPTMTCSREDSLVKRSASRESGKASGTPGERSSLKYVVSLTIRGRPISFLRTLRDSFLRPTPTKEDPPFPDQADGSFTKSWSRWGSWGTISNGRCSTAEVSASPKTESESTLSDILENSPDPKYFLSEKRQELWRKALRGEATH